MQHLKDAMLLVFTIVGALVLSTLLSALILVVLLVLLPASSESVIGGAYACLLFAVSIGAGSRLMQHLSWPWRFRIFAVVLPLCCLLSVIVLAAIKSSTMTVVDRLLQSTWQHSTVLVLSAGLLTGAAFVNWRQSRSSS